MILIYSQPKQTQMLSNTKCKQILNKKGVFYTDEEVVIIKKVLYKIAELKIFIIREILEENKNNVEEEANYN